MKTLALDLGTNSIGWALLSTNEDKEFGVVDTCGARIFQEAVEDKTRVPKNVARRSKRGMRKTIARRRMRRDLIQSILLRTGLLPESAKEREALFSDDSRSPYLLRAKGLDDELSLHELGRALCHISRRRGFKSNRKAKFAALADEPEVLELVEAEDKSAAPAKKGDDEGQIKAEITQLRKEMAEAKARTLGEFLWQKLESRAKVRSRHTDRSMYEDEFDQLWKSQARWHGAKLSNALRAEVHNAIFHQRPLKIQKFLVDNCRFEPERKRAPKALPLTQDVRIRQELNNLRYRMPGSKDELPLTQKQIEEVYEALQGQHAMAWSKVRTLAGIAKNASLNLESDNRDKIQGNSTAVRLRKAIPDHWDGLGAREQRDLLTDLLTIDRTDALYRRLRNHWKFSPEEAYALAIVELENGVASLSERAMRKILRHLEAGQSYHDACQSAGYQHDYEIETQPGEFLPEPPNLRNPVVQKALFEVRRVVNAVVKAHGKPDQVRIEMAREMKMNKKDKERFLKQQNTNRKLNEEADAFLKKLGIQQPSREDKLKYRLWKESCEVCPYTGRTITPEALFKSGEVDIEHIIPWSVSLDDSFANKTLCMAEENRLHKRNRTPYQAYAGDPERFAQILKRLDDMTAMHSRKRKLFRVAELKGFDDFANRQLSDTQYICRAVKQYIESIAVPVEVSKGGATAALRHRWGLNSVLHEATGEEAGKKIRDDHRHHIVDAIVVGVTTRSLFKKLSDLSAKYGGSLDLRGFDMPEPWPAFRKSVETAVGGIIVSHAASRKITGALHEETVYGPTSEKGVFVLRKKLDGDTSAGEIERIRDKHVRKIVQGRLADFEGDIKAAFGDSNQPVYLIDKAGKVVTNKEGMPRHIDSVRITVTLSDDAVFGVPDETGKLYKYFKYGSNHHVEIIENIATGKREGRFVTTMEAARRARIDRGPVVDRTAPEGWRFVMSLSIDDLVDVKDGDQTGVFRIQKMSGAVNNITLRHHLASGIDDNRKRLIRSPNTLRGVKVTVDPLGGLHPAHD